MLDSLVSFIVKPWSYPFVLNATLELLMLGVILSVVGCFVVLRGMVFFSHSLSHAIFPGIVVAYLLNINIVLGALAIATLINLTIGLTAASPRSGHTTTTVLYSGLFAFGIVLVSLIKTNKQLSELLFGRLFGVDRDDLWLTGLVGGGVLLIVMAFRKELLFVSFDRLMAKASGRNTTGYDLLFYLLMALVTIVTLPAIGNILAVAVLITPAATARLVTRRLTTMLGIAIGLNRLSRLLGVYLAFHLGWPPGATVVTLMSGLFVVSLAVRKLFGR